MPRELINDITKGCTILLINRTTDVPFLIISILPVLVLDAPVVAYAKLTFPRLLCRVQNAQHHHSPPERPMNGVIILED